MKIIQHQDDANKVIEQLNSEGGYILPWLSNKDIHPKYNTLSAVAIRTANKSYIIPITHNDGFHLSLDKLNPTRPVYTCFKKEVMYSIPVSNLFDVPTIEYILMNSITDIDTFYPTIAKQMFSSFKNYRHVGNAVPLVKIAEYFSTVFDYMDTWVAYTPIISHSSFKFMNDTILPSLHYIESAGLKINPDIYTNFYSSKIYDGFVMSQYNPYTKTGRPSNAYDGTNFSALNKSDGTRQSFVSRFGNNGKLYMIDYEGYHIRLIADLLNYKLTSNSVHEQFAQMYFGESGKPFTCTAELYELSKQKTFQIMYGHMSENDLNIEFFSKLNDYINVLWNDINTKSVIKSIVSQRPLQLKHIEIPNKTKVFNYLVQLLETEESLSRIHQVLAHLSNKQAKIILYTYDAILLDIPNDEANDINIISNIMTENGKYPVRIYTGSNYHSMQKM